MFQVNSKLIDEDVGEVESLSVTFDDQSQSTVVSCIYSVTKFK